jgi:multidrug efflux pump
MGGMIAVVVLALLMVPVFFVSVMRFFGRGGDNTESVAGDEPYGPPAQTIQ